MVEVVNRQICFRLADAAPAAPPPGPLRLADAQAEALSELLQVFARGEDAFCPGSHRPGARRLPPPSRLINVQRHLASRSTLRVLRAGRRQWRDPLSA
jgi:hypothetical protein